MNQPWLCPGWTVPRPGTPFRPAKLMNFARRIRAGQPNEGCLRVCYHLTDGTFRRGDRNILSEGSSNGQQIDTAAEYGYAIGACINGFRNLGDSDGDGYNRGGVLQAPGWVRSYARGCIEAHLEKGVRLKFVQWLNEGDYNPDEGNWSSYLAAVVESTRVVAEVARELVPGILLISGGQVLAETARGKKTIAQKFLEEGLYEELDMGANGHSNGQSIPEFSNGLAWARDRGLTVYNTEGRNVNGAPNSDNLNRYRAFKAEGARCYGFFFQRNVNAFLDNLRCKWGPGSNKPNRDDGCCFHCSHPPEGLPNPIEYQLFTGIAQASGWAGDPGDDLPMGEEEPPLPDPTPAIERAFDAWAKLHSPTAPGLLKTEANRARFYHYAKHFGLEVPE